MEVLLPLPVKSETPPTSERLSARACETAKTPPGTWGGAISPASSNVDKAKAMHHGRLSIRFLPIWDKGALPSTTPTETRKSSDQGLNRVRRSRSPIIHSIRNDP
ncbi:hypothetical protein ACLBXM_21330 [Xanthobacteraceae bacterium A53D]